MKNMSVKLPDSLAAKLATEARKRGITKSFVVREALEVYVARRIRRQKESFGELARAYRGCFEGAEDLSTNPAYLIGFGR